MNKNYLISFGIVVFLISVNPCFAVPITFENSFITPPFAGSFRNIAKFIILTALVINLLTIVKKMVTSQEGMESAVKWIVSVVVFIIAFSIWD